MAWTITFCSWDKGRCGREAVPDGWLALCAEHRAELARQTRTARQLGALGRREAARKRAAGRA